MTFFSVGVDILEVHLSHASVQMFPFGEEICLMEPGLEARFSCHGHMLLLVLCSFFQPSIQSTQSPHSVPDSTLSRSLVVLQVQSYLCDKVIMSSRTEIVWHVVASPRPPPARVWQEKPGGKHFLTWLWNARYTRDTFFTYLMGPRGPYKIHTVTYGKSSNKERDVFLVCATSQTFECLFFN